MNKKKVLVTGMGVISPLGNRVSDLWENCKKGKSGVGKILRFDTDNFPVKIAGFVRGFDPLDYMDKKLMRSNDPFVHYTFGAMSEAMESSGLMGAGLGGDKVDRRRIGVILGSGMGGVKLYSKNNYVFSQYGWRKVSPFFIPSTITNIASGLVAIQWGLEGPNFSISTACATSNHTILESMNIIRRGEADIMVAGASEAALTPMGLAGFCAARALSTRNDEPEKASRPFDRGRDGFVLGEGCGVMILESEESALRRGRHIYGEVLGGGMNCDAHHITAPREDGSGVIRCMELAIENSGIKKEDIDYINAHGTSTQLGDHVEQFAIRKVFGDHSKNLKVNSTKSMIGHLLGSAGSVEGIIALKSLSEGYVHPTINLEDLDESYNLDFVANHGVEYDFEHALSNSFGFGGHNCSIVFKKY